MTHLSLKCEQLSGKLRDIFALKLSDVNEYEAQIEEALFARPVLRLNLYKDADKIYIENKAYCLIKSSAFQNFINIKSLTLDSSNIYRFETDSFKELSCLKELNLLFFFPSHLPEYDCV